jgi:hypothetical protein
MGCVTFGDAVAALPVAAPVREVPAGLDPRPLVILTSLSPNPARAAVQWPAIASWRAAGGQVRSMNHPAEITALAAVYDVEFVPCLKTTYGHFIPYTEVYAHLREVAGQSLFINSDIVLRLTPAQLAGFAAGCRDGLGMLVRYNHDGDERVAAREPYGIDGWLLDPHRFTLPDAFLAVGRPAGDYWFPAEHLKQGLPLYTNADPVVFHLRHPQAWDADLWATGAAELCRLHDPGAAGSPAGQAALTQRLHAAFEAAPRLRVLP